MPLRSASILPPNLLCGQLRLLLGPDALQTGTQKWQVFQLGQVVVQEASPPESFFGPNGQKTINRTLPYITLYIYMYYIQTRTQAAGIQIHV